MSDSADKLAKTRLAIVAHIQRRDRKNDRTQAGSDRAQVEGEDEDEAWNESQYSSGPAAWFGHVKHAANAWWRQHPARMGVQLATPLLSKYASQKPLTFLGVAAVLGAVVVVARPWRLISLTGLVVALVKSSQLSNVVMQAMSAADFPKDQQRPR